MSETSPIDLVPVLERFAARLVVRADALNEMNVFPVADGDTGTNMAATVAGILDEVRASSELAKAVGRAALRHGKGNSGLILGQFLAGFAAAAEQGDLGSALKAGALQARAAVSRPAEGTMLSVADAAAGASDPGQALELAQAALARTPHQLAVLAEAGVVDAGGAGLIEFFAALAGETVETEPGMAAIGAAQAEGQLVGYEVMFTVEGDRADLMQALDQRGTDVVVAQAEDAALLRAHVHVAVADRDAMVAWAEAEGSDIVVSALLAQPPSLAQRPSGEEVGHD